MNVLNLAAEVGLIPKKTASTKGGEYHSSCPDCGGENRFCIWPQEGSSGRYWCRQCERKGDAIEFCREFMGMSFPDACEKVGKSIPISLQKFPRFKQREFSPLIISPPHELWRRKASEFVFASHKTLCESPHLINSDKDRGLDLKAIQDCKLGWNNEDIFQSREEWGLSIGCSGSKSICLPEGIVIPCFRETELLRVKVRRHNWVENDLYPKYQIIAGGVTCPSIYGEADKPLILVEAELDAMLIQKVAGDLCCCIALGGVSNKPDLGLHDIIKNAKLVLFSLDFDESGKKHFNFWKSTYKNLRAWPVPKGKSPGDAYQLGVDLRKWVTTGIHLIGKSKIN